MPENFQIVDVSREGISPGARPLPQNSATVVIPVSQDQIHKDAQPGAEPVKVTSIEEAFKKFAPKIAVTAKIDGVMYQIESEIRSMRGFTPEALEERQEVKGPSGEVVSTPNDLATLKETVSLLTRLKEAWNNPQVRAMWQDPTKRAAIIKAFGLLRAEMSSISGGEGFLEAVTGQIKPDAH